MIRQLLVDRVVVRGATVGEVAAGELRGVFERALADAFAKAPLPKARAVHAAVEVWAGRLTSGATVASALARSVAQIANGGSLRG